MQFDYFQLSWCVYAHVCDVCGMLVVMVGEWDILPCFFLSSILVSFLKLNFLPVDLF